MSSIDKGALTVLDRTKPCPSGAVYAHMETRASAKAIVLAASRIGVGVDAADCVVDAYRGSSVTAGVFTGKMYSGKDTVADQVAAALHVPGSPEAERHTVSDGIREEYAQILRIIKDASGPKVALKNLCGEMNLDDRPANYFFSSLFTVLREQDIDANERTPLNRTMTIYLADDGRRSADPEYWVKVSFRRMLSALSTGHSAYLAGCRYPNEISPALALGIHTTRLEISHEVQAQRGLARDGHLPDPKVILGVNECALDEFTGLNLIVGNDDDIETTLGVITEDFHSHAERAAAI